MRIGLPAMMLGLGLLVLPAASPTAVTVPCGVAGAADDAADDVATQEGADLTALSAEDCAPDQQAGPEATNFGFGAGGLLVLGILGAGSGTSSTAPTTGTR